MLATFERWFVVVAIASYLAPPVYLYLVGDDLTDRSPSTEHANGTDGRRDGMDADSDSDGADADFDTDGIDGDADADGADADADG